MSKYMYFKEKIKSGTRVYISGKMTGLTEEEYIKKFEEAEDLLKKFNLEPINPSKYHTGGGLTYAQIMLLDLELLTTCGAIYMLDNWETSKGAIVELKMAEALRLIVWFQDRKQEVKYHTISLYNSLKPFTCTDEIPDIPVIDQITYNTIVVPNLIRCGAIPINELEKDVWYEGTCRNASKAIWNGEKFLYERTKFGDTFFEEINHFQEDDGYDVFVPLKKIENEFN